MVTKFLLRHLTCTAEETFFNLRVNDMVAFYVCFVCAVCCKVISEFLNTFFELLLDGEFSKEINELFAFVSMFDDEFPSWGHDGSILPLHCKHTRKRRIQKIEHLPRYQSLISELSISSP